MSMSDAEINKLMQDVGEIKANVANIKETLNPALDKIEALETKINKHTGILAVFGTACLFFKEKILGILNI